MTRPTPRPPSSIDGDRRLHWIFRWTSAVTIVANLVYFWSTLAVDKGTDGYVTLWDGWVFHIATTLPAVVAGIYAYLDRRNPVPWWFVTAGISLNTIANLIYTYYDQNLDPVPFPGYSDIAFLASYAAFAVALVLITQGRVSKVTRSVRLDGLIIGLSAGAVAVTLWFRPILDQTGSTLSVLVGLAYPLFDVVFLVIVIAGLAPARYRPTGSALAFMAGISVFAFGDIVYLTREAAGTYSAGGPLEVTWALGVVLFGFAPWLDTAPREVSERTAPGLSVAPTFAAFAALSVLAFGVGGTVPVLASFLAIGAVAAILSRVGLTVRELRNANEAFSQARTDDLTGLLNRRGFGHDVDRLLASGTEVSVLLIDLDGFKEVNDSLGHPVGDQLLQVVAKRLATALPDAAVVARLGGDEFGIAVGAADLAPTEIAARITESLNHPVSLDGMTVRVGASTGIACSPDHGTTREELLRAADVAMYDAKRNHLDTAEYSAERDPHSRDRLALIEELRAAIDHRSFEMHYQPTISVDTGAVVGMEALIRWNHPTRGMVPPDDFIPLAERVGLIPAITRAVLDIAIAHLARMHDRGLELGLSVNISAKDLVDEQLPEYISATLAGHGVAPHFLTLEITETALAADSGRAERTLSALRAEGMRVSIDDFGVGYSSMSQLLRLPLDELKLDRSFIASLFEDVRAQAILSATVELGRTLGLDIVAEGVETVEALDEIRFRGVDTVQGYYLSKALDSAAFEAFVAQRNGVSTV